jgi:hypothetical protein
LIEFSTFGFLDIFLDLIWHYSKKNRQASSAGGAVAPTTAGLSWFQGKSNPLVQHKFGHTGNELGKYLNYMIRGYFF